MAQDAAYTNLALTPRDNAAVSSSAVACMERPHRVYLKKATKTRKRIMASTKDQKYTVEIFKKPIVNGLREKMAGVKTLVSVPQTNPTNPLRKKERPTVTIMIARIGSPISLSRKILSTRIPRTIPMSRVNKMHRIKGTPIK